MVMSWAVIGCAASGEKSFPTDSSLRRTTAALERAADADSLAAAGLLSLTSNRDAGFKLVVRATESAPARPDLQWLRIQICGQLAGCDQEVIEHRLRDLDPSNGVGWLGALVRANSSSDEEAKDAALEAIGRSDHIDIYWTALIARLSRATARTQTMSAANAMTAIIGMLAAEATPAYTAASTSCRGERLQRAGVIESCRGVARALERGDTYLTEMVGVEIARRVWAQDSPEWQAATDARRLYLYRSQLLPASEAWEMSHADQYLTLCAQNRREQDVLLAQLIIAGKNPNPPTD